MFLINERMRRGTEKLKHKPPLHLAARALCHHWHALRYAVGLRCRHTIRVGMVATFEEHIHTRTADALSRRNRAVSVCEKKRLQVDNLLAELRHSLG